MPASFPGLRRSPPAVFAKRPQGVVTSDLMTAACLSVPGWFWGNSVADRDRGPSKKLKAGDLAGVEVYIAADKGQYLILFHIKGDPVELRMRRFLIHSGQFYIERDAYRKRKADLTDLFERTKKDAEEKLKRAQAVGVLETGQG